MQWPCFSYNSMAIIINLIMRKIKKKNNNQNTDKLVVIDSLTDINNFTDINKLDSNNDLFMTTDSLRNYTGRTVPMAHNTGPTIKRRRRQFGGNI